LKVQDLEFCGADDLLTKVSNQLLLTGVAVNLQNRPNDAAVALYVPAMLQRTLPAGFIAPCLPTKTDKLPSGDLWLYDEISMTASGLSHAGMATACGSAAVPAMTSRAAFR
jgi:hypothetical protein